MAQSRQKQKNSRIGDLLVESSVITTDQLDQGLLYKDEAGVRLGEGLVNLGFLSKKQLQEFLLRQVRQSRIGELLVADGQITEDQLTAALLEQKKTGAKLGQTLERLGFLAEHPFLTFLAKQLSLVFVDLGKYSLDFSEVRRLPEAAARRFRASILKATPQEILIGMTDPSDLVAYDQLVKLLQTPLQIALVAERSLLRI